MSNPLKDFLKTKTAVQLRLPGMGMGRSAGELARQVGGRAGDHVISGAGTALGAAGVTAAGVAAMKIYDALSSGRNFRTVLANNPDIEAAHQANPKQVNLMYSSLRTFNPTFAKDPLVAGTYLRQMLEDPGHAGGLLERALQSREKMPSPISAAFQGGARSGGGGGRQ